MRFLPIILAILLVASPRLTAGEVGMSNGITSDNHYRPGDPSPDGADADNLSPADEGLVRVEVHGVAAADMLVRFVGDTLYLPYILTCDFLRLPNSVSADRQTLTGEFPAGTPYTIDRSTRRYIARGDTVEYPYGVVREIGGQVFVEHSLLFEAVGLATRFDLMALKLVVDPHQSLPIVQWQKSGNRLAQIQNAEHVEDSPAFAPMRRSLLGNPILDWNLAGAAADQRISTALTLRTGTELLWGSAELSTTLALQNAEQSSITSDVNSWSWRFSMPRFSVLRQITVGTMGIGRNSYIGLQLDNAPLAPRREFGLHTIAGYSQPGWMIEMYHANRLIDMVQADSNGHYMFEIPVGYGTTDRTLHHIGPRGERIVEQRRLQLNPDMIPAGQLQYTLRGGIDQATATDPVHAAVGGEARIDAGLTQSISLGIEGMLHSPSYRMLSADSLYATALANLWLGGTTSLSLRHALRQNLSAAELLVVMPSSNSLRLSVDSLNIRNSTFTSSISGSHYLGRFSIAATGHYSRWADMDMVKFEPAISGYVPGVSFSLGTTLGLPVIKRFDDPAAGEIVDSLEVAPGNGRALDVSLGIIATPLSWLVLNTQVKYDLPRQEFTTLRASAYSRVSNIFGLNLSYNVSRGNFRQASLQLQTSVVLGFSRAALTSSYSHGEVSAASIAEGSLLVSGAGVAARPDASVGQAALIFTAFHDRNFNGRRDAGEESLEAPWVNLTMNGLSESADNGRLYGLPPNRLCEVEVDKWMHVERGLYPARQHYALYTAPSSQQVIDVPYSEGFDVVGRCSYRSDDTSDAVSNSPYINGLRVQLIGLDGSSVYDGEVYSDGSIYIPAVASGHYRILFDQAQLGSRRLKIIEAPKEVMLTTENPELPEVVLGKYEG